MQHVSFLHNYKLETLTPQSLSGPGPHCIHFLNWMFMQYITLSSIPYVDQKYYKGNMLAVNFKEFICYFH